MIRCTASLQRWLGSARGRRRLRYAAVSAISVLAGQATLGVAFGVLGWSARSANYLAFVAGAIPSYTLNRRWTWQRRGRSHPLREIASYWAIAIAGFAASTLAVSLAEHLAPGLTESRALQTAIVMTAALSAYGTLWIAKFIAFDRLLFASRPTRLAKEIP